MQLTKLDIMCPCCASTLHRCAEEDAGGYQNDVGIWCVPVLGGCGLLIADTAAESVEALSCQS